MPMGDLLYEWKNMMEYERGFNDGHLQGLKDAANTQVPVSPSADQPRNLRPAAMNTKTSACEPTGAYATSQSPEGLLEAWGLPQNPPPNLPEDSKPDQENPQWDYPRRPYSQDPLPPADPQDQPDQAFLDHQEEVLDQLEFVLEQFQAEVQVLDQLLEDAATLFDSRCSKEDPGWQQECLPEGAFRHQPPVSGPYAAQDANPDFAWRGPQTGPDQWSPR